MVLREGEVGFDLPLRGQMADASDTSLWPVIVGGALALVGSFGGVIIANVFQGRREKEKRQAEKFEELVKTIYEFESWLIERRDSSYDRDSKPREIISPLAKIDAITAIYFSRFMPMVHDLSRRASSHFEEWIAHNRRDILQGASSPDGHNEAYGTFLAKRSVLLEALSKFADEEFAAAAIKEEPVLMRRRSQCPGDFSRLAGYRGSIGHPSGPISRL
jgi:hypothetical protein